MLTPQPQWHLHARDDGLWVITNGGCPTFAMGEKVYALPMPFENAFGWKIERHPHAGPHAYTYVSSHRTLSPECGGADPCPCVARLTLSSLRQDHGSGRAQRVGHGRQGAVHAGELSSVVDDGVAVLAPSLRRHGHGQENPVRHPQLEDGRVPDRQWTQRTTC